MPEGHGSVGACGSSQTTFSTGPGPLTARRKTYRYYSSKAASLLSVSNKDETVSIGGAHVGSGRPELDGCPKSLGPVGP
jgi:hypothetical protein